ncbi:hypothetical protein HYH02_015134 [Chlamydomonas schloesseri]|uniref:Amine oxidase domain-containing protein n=1 Tax=Chlamydomonas schloesseri TaxID=2026947 RepID=A0A835VPU6_9CHLO|nr:hypothetical protein HYH02_015134 [Chlamydomonas schloesseri]|eukprot:KAG2424752.1 hypothetical protein HYH02_015134 [Chlamydomonas schloesseri]
MAGRVFDLVIVGAGFAGLGAAHEARKRGIKSVLVLEARDRIGGRTVSAPLDLSLPANAPVPGVIDLGAAWIHGAGSKARGPNPMVTLAKSLGHPTFNVTEGDMSFGPNGQEDSDAWYNAVEDMGDRFNTYYTDVYLESSSASKRDSMATVRDRFIAAQKPALTATQRAALAQFLATEYVLDYGDDVELLSGLLTDEDRAWGGPDALPGRSYGAMAAALAAAVTAAPGSAAAAAASSNNGGGGAPVELRLGHAVTNIAYGAAGGAGGASSSGNSGVVVLSGRNQSGAGAAFSVTAKYVIVTLPLGYLQAQLSPSAPPPPSGPLFSPPLPAAQVAALMALGMGALEKVVLAWQPGDMWWRDIITTPWVTVRNTDTTPGVFSEYYNLAATPAKLPVLICFNGGSPARALAALSDAEVVARALAPLRKLLPASRQAAFPPPTRTYVTRWASDPWARGAYSFERAGADEDTKAAAFRAVAGGRVGFAGEATYGSYPSTVHGAYLSGLREAARVAEAL